MRFQKRKSSVRTVAENRDLGKIWCRDRSVFLMLKGKDGSRVFMRFWQQSKSRWKWPDLMAFGS